MSEEIRHSGNFCRNPGGLSIKGPWCYYYITNKTLNWKHCDVPKCSPKGTYTDFCLNWHIHFGTFRITEYHGWNNFFSGWGTLMTLDGLNVATTTKYNCHIGRLNCKPGMWVRVKKNIEKKLISQSGLNLLTVTMCLLGLLESKTDPYDSTAQRLLVA